MELTFRDNETVERDFSLKAQPVSLASVTVLAPPARRGRLAGFDARRATGLGFFIGRDELEKNEAKRLSELITHVPGARVVRGKGGSEAWVGSSRGRISVLLHQSLDVGDLERGA